MTPATVAAIRLALGAAVVLAVVRARPWAMPRGWRWWRHALVVGLFGSALPFMLAWGEQYVSSACLKEWVLSTLRSSKTSTISL